VSDGCFRVFVSEQHANGARARACVFELDEGIHGRAAELEFVAAMAAGSRFSILRVTTSVAL